MEMDIIQEAPSLSRRQRQATGELERWSKAGRSLKDVRHGLPTEVDVPKVDSLEAAAAKEASFEQEVGRVLLQWGQSSEGLQEMLLQVIPKRHGCCIAYMTGLLLLFSSARPKSVCFTNIRKILRKHLCNMKIAMLVLPVSALLWLAVRTEQLCCR